MLGREQLPRSLERVAGILVRCRREQDLRAVGQDFGPQLFWRQVSAGLVEDLGHEQIGELERSTPWTPRPTGSAIQQFRKAADVPKLRVGGRQTLSPGKVYLPGLRPLEQVCVGSEP